MLNANNEVGAVNVASCMYVCCTKLVVVVVKPTGGDCFWLRDKKAFYCEATRTFVYQSEKKIAYWYCPTRKLTMTSIEEDFIEQ